MQRILTSFVLILLGLFSMTQVAKLLGGYGQLNQLVILTVFVIAFSYFSVEMIVWMMRKTNMLQAEQSLLQTWHGHFSNALGAFVLTFSFINQQLGLLFVGMVIIWLAMLLLTRVDRQAAAVTIAPVDSVLPGALEDIPDATERQTKTKIAASAVDPDDARAEKALVTENKAQADKGNESATKAEAKDNKVIDFKAHQAKSKTQPKANTSDAALKAQPQQTAQTSNALRQIVQPGIKASVRAAILHQKKEDPLIALKVGGEDIAQTISQILASDKGVRVECALGIIGALAGYSCHIWAMTEYESLGSANASDALVLIKDKAGRVYCYGSLPNQMLLEDPYSVWSIVGGIAQSLSPKPLLDIDEIAKEVVDSVGENFGVPQLPQAHLPSDLPINYVKVLWPLLEPKINQYCETFKQRPMLLGFAARELINNGKEAICPMLAAEIVMKCALPMSKIGAEWLEAEYKRPY